ncbi:MAG TPA: LysM peptidoglycan-binding domain-containing protein [Bryobacteraceae bacterium]
MKYVIKQGDCLSSLAGAYGLRSWQDLYDRADNAGLKEKRSNPNVLAPGDEVTVPDAATEKKIVPCATGKAYLFIVDVPKVKLRILLQDWKGEPYADKKFEVTIEGKLFPGRTDGEGLIDIPIPAAALSGRLKVWLDEDDDDPNPSIDRDLDVGHLDPASCVTGLQARLHNLGHRCEVNGNLDEDTLAAVRAYRAKTGLPEVEDDDALVDDDLRSSLVKLHDGE